MAKRRAWLGVLIVAALALVGLASCGRKHAPATTEELLVRYVANENVDNFKAKVNVDVTASALGVSAKIPVTADIEAAEKVAHGTLTVDLSSLDTRNYQAEFYAQLEDQSIVCYIGTPGERSAAWKRWTINMTESIDIFTVTNLLQASELTKMARSTDDKVAFELAVPLSKILETAFDLADDPVEIGGMDEQALIKSAKTDKVRVDFTEDCLLRSVSGSYMLNLQSAETNNIVVKIAIDGASVLDDYGTVDQVTATVPDEIKNAATNTDNPVDIVEILGPDSPFAAVIPK